MRNRLTFLALLIAFAAQAQYHEGGTPPGLEPENQLVLSKQTVSPVQLPALDKAALQWADAQTPGQSRFAAAVPANVSVENSGSWTTLPDGRKLWRCLIQSPGALGLLLLFDQFYVPPGARVYAYDASKTKILGAYTAQSCLASGKFLIGVLPGEAAWLECVTSAEEQANVQLHINRVDVAFVEPVISSAEFDFGESLPCNVNINCNAGANWQTEKKGIARVLMVFQDGAAWCSGTLIANTAGTFEPYFLTAHHCQLLLPNPEFDLWRFDFEYESTTCGNPNADPVPKSVLGSERIAYRAQTDFMLLKLNPIPASYDVYFNGWNRDNATTVLSPGTTMIHHPVGDIKKITLDTHAAVIFQSTLDWGGIFGVSPAGTHWKTIPDVGIQQPGSSGSPLFDANKRIRGQLHGGSVSMTDQCVMTGVYYGRFNQSWDQGGSSTSRLKEWLDPAATNTLTQNGYARPLPPGYTISGTVQTHWGDAMSGVRVKLSDAGGSTLSAFTDAAGQFVFQNVAGGQNYTVLPERDSNDVNGLTTFDMVLMSKHILGIESFNSPWKMIAADVNKSNSITTFDIVEARKVLQGINPAFPANTAWRFFPAFVVFSDPNNPFIGSLPPNNITINNLQGNYTNANFKGIKIGDVNNTADGGQ